MDGSSYPPKRPFDQTPTNWPEPYSPAAKRRHPPLPPPSLTPPPPISHRPPPPPPLNLSAQETLFRILCPAANATDAAVRHLQDDTGARIRLDNSVSPAVERMVIISSDSTKRHRKSDIDNSAKIDVQSRHSSSEFDSDREELLSAAQAALVRVFETIVKAEDEGREEGNRENVRGEVVCCRLLAPSVHVVSVLGNQLDRIRQGTGAVIKVLSGDQMPHCGYPGDELIEITGNFSAVRDALLLISGCLQDNPMPDASNVCTPSSAGTLFVGSDARPRLNLSPHLCHASDHQTLDHPSRNYPSSRAENIGMSNRMVHEEDVLFKLLCQVDKVGCIIGKGGSIVRVLQAETGASIKIAEAAASDTDEKIVVISAKENSEQRHSPAQEALMRVHSRIAEIGFESGAPPVARLLAHSHQLRVLFGDGGALIADLRRATGANIQIFPTKQVLKYGSPSEEVVQIIGSFQAVQDALFQITRRLRETIFPPKQPFASTGGPPHFHSHPDMSPRFFRPMHDPASPGYPSPSGMPRESWHAFSRSMDRRGHPYPNRVSHSCSSERRGHCQVQPSPGRWTSQAVGPVSPAGAAEFGSNYANSYPSESKTAPPSITIEVVIPHVFLNHVYGENNSNLEQIRQMSGSNVVVHDPTPGDTEGMVVISGSPDQTRTAQILLHACIIAEQKP